MDYTLAPFDALNESFLRSLVDNQVTESTTLDYKSRLVLLKSDAEKRDYLKDVSALANTRGGIIVWGVEENDGAPTRIVGIGDSSADTCIMQLEQLVAAATVPAVPDIRSKAVVIDGSTVVIQRIGRSLIGPHMIAFGGYDRFYFRMSRQNARMDYGGIKRAFSAAEERIDAMRRSRSQRVARIVARDTPVILESERLVALHVMPIVGRDVPLSAAAIRMCGGTFSPLWADHPGSAQVNFDGVAFHDGTYREQATSTYCQVFRNGMVESVGPTGLVSSERLSMLTIEPGILKKAGEYIDGLLKLDFTPTLQKFLTPQPVAPA